MNDAYDLFKKYAGRLRFVLLLQLILLFFMLSATFLTTPELDQCIQRLTILKADLQSTPKGYLSNKIIHTLTDNSLDSKLLEKMSLKAITDFFGDYVSFSTNKIAHYKIYNIIPIPLDTDLTTIPIANLPLYLPESIPAQYISKINIVDNDIVKLLNKKNNTASKALAISIYKWPDNKNEGKGVLFIDRRLKKDNILSDRISFSFTASTTTCSFGRLTVIDFTRPESCLFNDKFDIMNSFTVDQAINFLKQRQRCVPFESVQILGTKASIENRTIFSLFFFSFFFLFLYILYTSINAYNLINNFKKEQADFLMRSYLPFSRNIIVRYSSILFLTSIPFILFLCRNHILIYSTEKTPLTTYYGDILHCIISLTTSFILISCAIRLKKRTHKTCIKNKNIEYPVRTHITKKKNRTRSSRNRHDKDKSKQQ